MVDPIMFEAAFRHIICNHRLFLLGALLLLTVPITHLEGNSINSGTIITSAQFNPMSIQTVTVPANNFSVISGSITGLPDNSITANVDRVRAAMTAPVSGVVSASYYFKILGSSPIVVPDSDGVTRQGVVFWVNMHNACNLYFLFWRTDSTTPAGTTMIGAKVQVNPTITSLDVNHSDLIACAGLGYSTLSQPDGTPAEISSSINIMDGNWHNFTLAKLGPERWRLYTDNIFAFEAYDPTNNFALDSNLWGLRLDNIQTQIYYQLTTTTTQASTSFTVAPPTGEVGQLLSFSAFTSGGSPPYAYSWTFGDNVGTSTAQSPAYAYASPGSYTVVLTTTDSLGKTTTSLKSVNISAGPTPQSHPPTGPPSNHSGGGTCLFCNTSMLVSTLSLLTIGAFAGVFLSVGIFLSRYHAHNRRLATELRWENEMSRRASGLPDQRARITGMRVSRGYGSVQGKARGNRHRRG
jgi:PKD domain-containing protein